MFLLWATISAAVQTLVVVEGTASVSVASSVTVVERKGADKAVTLSAVTDLVEVGVRGGSAEVSGTATVSGTGSRGATVAATVSSTASASASGTHAGTVAVTVSSTGSFAITYTRTGGADALKLEDGSYLLQEDGSKLLLE